MEEKLVNQKRYFVIKIILLVIGGIFIILLGNLYKYKVDENNKYLRVPHNLKLINLGSSHGEYGLKYDKNIKYYNLANESQPFYYDLKLLKKYKNNFERNAIIIIPISVFSFYPQMQEIKKLNDKYYPILDFTEIYEGDKKQMFLKKYFQLLYRGKDILKILKYLKNCIKERKLLITEKEYPNNLNLNDKIK